MRGQVSRAFVTIIVLPGATSCLSPDDGSGRTSSNTGGECAASAPAPDLDTASHVEPASHEPDWALDACFWSAWECGVIACPSGYYVHGADFNATQSEGCWGSGNSFDEPFRRLECCSASFASHDGCYWTGWGCGDMRCAPGYYTAGVNFNANQSEGCWGSGNDLDEPERKLKCCNSHASPSHCYWTGWGCGDMTCAPGYYTAGFDFNINQSEGCWGAGNNFDEPTRRVYCCT